MKDWFDGIGTQPQLTGVGFGRVRPAGNRACGEKKDFGRNILHLAICMGLLPFPPPSTLIDGLNIRGTVDPI